MKKEWGGARPNAGRKPSSDTKEKSTLSLWVTEEEKAALKEYLAQIRIQEGKNTMKDTEVLKQALEKAVNECTEVRIKEVAASCGIKHIKSNDLRVMCASIIKAHPEYRLVQFTDGWDGNPSTLSLFEHGVITCCEYDDGSEYDEHKI